MAKGKHVVEELKQPVVNVKEEKKRDLYLRQKETLDLFLERGAISKAQHDQSLMDMMKKMGMHDMDE